MRIFRKFIPMAMILTGLCACESRGPVSSGQGAGANPLEVMLRFPASVIRQEGIAAAILMDTSGSMRDTVADIDGLQKPKIEIARRAALDSLRQFEDFARRNPERKVLVGVYEFSSRDRAHQCRQVVPIGLPNAGAAAPAIDAMIPSGGTPIGNAMVQAKLDLDRTGMSRRHILVVTDGQNNVGYSPGDVVNAIGLLPEEERAPVYFIAFDIGAGHFKDVKDAGGMVLAASSGSDLKQTLDFVLTGKILVEQPAVPAGR